jgi:hypothetical protein
MQFESHERRWRWMALFAVLANIVFGYLAHRLQFGAGSVEQVGARYGSLFTPAGYVYAIWTLIQLTTLAYAIHQLLPSQRSAYAHDLLVRPLIVLNLLGMAWLVMLQYGLIMPGMLVIVVMLAASLLAFVRTTAAVTRHEISRWALLPASLWFGWLSIVFLASASMWLAALGWTLSIQKPWTLAMIAVAALLGLGVGYRYRNGIYPLVIAWGIGGIGVARHPDQRTIAIAALAAAALMIVWSGYSFARARRARSGFRIFRGPIDAR